MTSLRWDDPQLKMGTMVRGALWLLQVVGEGNTFTKDELREAFPGVSQADRRVRDLRDYGWLIYTSLEDASLSSETQRFISPGVAVWDPVARRVAAPDKTVSNVERRRILASDDYMCTVCGIAGGEEYADGTRQAAVLSISRRETVLPDGEVETLLVTECKRCRAGAGETPAQADTVLASIRDLAPEDRRRLALWVNRGRRGSTPLERAWSGYRRLPADARIAIMDELSSAD